MTNIPSSIDSLQSAYNRGSTISTDIGDPVAITTPTVSDIGLSITDGTDTLELYGSKIVLPDGGAGTPSLTFASATNSGFYWSGGGVFAGTSGTFSAIFWSNTVSFRTGSAGAPGIGFSGVTSTGLFAVAANNNELGITSGGSKIAGFSSNLSDGLLDEVAISFTPTIAKLSGTNNYTALLIDVAAIGNLATGADNRLQDWKVDGASQAYLTDDGRLLLNQVDANHSAADPTLALAANYGLYYFGGTIHMYSAGASSLRVTSDGLATVTSGTEALPAFRFATATGNGMWRPSTTETALSAGGVEGLRVNASGQTLHATGSTALPPISFIDDAAAGIQYSAGKMKFFKGGAGGEYMRNTTTGVQVPAGSVAIPSYAVGEPATGIYRVAGGTLGLTAGGVLALSSRSHLESVIADESSHVFNTLVTRAGAPAFGWTALTVNVDVTSGPDTSTGTKLLQDWQVGGVSQARILSDGRAVFGSSTTHTAADPTIRVGSANVGIYASSNTLSFTLSDTKMLTIIGNGIRSYIDGTALLPAWTFGNSVGHGMWRASSTELAFSASGVEFLRGNDSGQTLHQDGTSLAPGISWAGAATMGFHRVNSSRFDIYLGGAAYRMINYRFDILFAGTEATPALTLDGDLDAGLWAPVAGTIAVSSNSTERMRWDAARTTLTAPTEARVGGADYSEALKFVTTGTDLQTASIILGSDDPNGGTAVNSGELGSLFWDATGFGLYMKTAASLWVPFATGGSVTMQGAYDGGPGVTLDSATPIVLTPFAVTDTALSTTGRVVIGLGSAGAPSLKVGPTTETGLWSNGSILYMTTSGVTRFSISGGGIGVTGPAGIVSLTDSATGLYWPSASVLALKAASVEAFRINSSGQTLFHDGALGAPSISFLSDPTHGFKYVSATQFDLEVNGGVKISFVSSACSFKTELNVLPGTAGNPTIGISGYGGTGLSSSGTNHVGFSSEAGAIIDTIRLLDEATGDEVAVAITPFIDKLTSGNYTAVLVNVDTLTGVNGAPGATNLLLDLQVDGTSAAFVSDVGDGFFQRTTLGNGTAALPSHTFLLDTELGMYRHAGNVLGLSSEGATVATFRRVLDGTTDEVSVEITPTVNKVTSGNYTALRVAVSETSLAGSGNDHRLLDLKAGATGTTDRAYVTNGGLLRVTKGGYTAPGLSFIGDENTGIFGTGAGGVVITADATDSAAFFATKVVVYPAGSAAAPSLDIGNNSDGLYSPAAKQLGLAADGEAVIVDNDSATPSFRPDSHQVWALGESGFQWNKVYVGIGTSTDPSLHLGTGGIGLWKPAANQLGFQALDESVILDNDGAVPSLRPDVTAVWTLGEASFRWDVGYFDVGTEALPSISLRDTDLGLYSHAADGLSLAGNTRHIEANFVTLDFTPDDTDVWDLGTTTKAWGTLYATAVDTGDIHLTSRNDETRYTMVEDARGLFLRNLTTGKSYRIMMEEVPDDEAPRTLKELGVVELAA